MHRKHNWLNTFKVNVSSKIPEIFQLTYAQSLGSRGVVRAEYLRDYDLMSGRDSRFILRQPREHLHGQSGPPNETRWARTVPQPLQPQSVSTLVMKRAAGAKLCKKERATIISDWGIREVQPQEHDGKCSHH